jgi:DNA-binding MarR family transcriptional regulator
VTVHSKVVRRLDAQLAASHRMTLNEFEVLLKLELAGGSLRMSDLAQAALLSRSGLTRIIDELEAQELVGREPDEDDGRVLIAKLTRRGRPRFGAARRAHVAAVQALFLNPLTPEQRCQLGAVWAAIEGALPDIAEEREAPRVRRRRRRLQPRP